MRCIGPRRICEIYRFRGPEPRDFEPLQELAHEEAPEIKISRNEGFCLNPKPHNPKPYKTLNPINPKPKTCGSISLKPKGPRP